MSSGAEHREQSLLVEHLRVHGIGVFSVPNGAILGGKNKYALLNKLRAEGLEPGAPDLVLCRLASNGRPIAVEMKSKEGRPSSAQVEMHEMLRHEGWILIVAHSYLEAVEALRAWGVPI